VSQSVSAALRAENDHFAVQAQRASELAKSQLGLLIPADEWRELKDLGFLKVLFDRVLIGYREWWNPYSSTPRPETRGLYLMRKRLFKWEYEQVQSLADVGRLIRQSRKWHPLCDNGKRAATNMGPM